MSAGEYTEKQETALPIYTALGHRLNLTFPLIRFSIAQPRFFLFFGNVVAILILFDTHNYRQVMGFLKSALIWSVNVSTVVFLYLVILSALIGLKKYIHWLAVYMPVVGATSMALASLLTIQMAYMLDDSLVPDGMFWDHLAFNISAVLIFETLFLIYVTPILQRKQIESLRKGVSSKRVMSVGGEDVPIADIVYMQAQDHYVSIYLREGKQMMPRARMRDLARQFTDDEGTMAHRSYWIAWHEVADYKVSAESLVLTMSNGAKVPVSKGRKAEVERGLKAKSRGILRALAAHSAW